MSNFQHFTDEEIKGLDPALPIKLEQARTLAGIPFVITSGLRTPEENAACGGEHDSAHLRGLAVDLHCDQSVDRFHMVQSMLAAGFTRLGIYEDHIHADIDETLPQDVMWMKDKP